MQVVEKTPDTELLFDLFDFTDDLPDDTALASNSTVTAVDADGESRKKVIGTVSRSGMILRAILKGGINGQDYVVNFSAIGQTTARQVTKQLELRVRSETTGAA